MVVLLVATGAFLADKVPGVALDNASAAFGFVVGAHSMESRNFYLLWHVYQYHENVLVVTTN